MADMKNENTNANGQTGTSAGRETVGDILRRERVTRRMTIETIAKDLKLNPTYIKALEANNYDQLPADPYVRVYLRSIAGYLTLDPEQILRTFYEERGMKPVLYKDERSTKLTITTKEPQRRQTSWIVIALVILGLAILSYVANKRGWISSATHTTAPQQPAQPDTAATADDDAIIDSMAVAGDSADPAAPVSSKAAGAAAVQPADSLRLEISADRDSVWVQLFSDGVSWRSYLYAGKHRAFTAADSFNIHIGHAKIFSMALNGKPLPIKEKGVACYKIDRAGIAPWSQSKWNNVFKERLK